MADVYIAGALKQAPSEWWKIYEKIAEICKQCNLTTHIPHIDTVNETRTTVEDIYANPNLDSKVRENIFKTNFEAVKKARLIIAEVTKPSIGVGMEIGFALETNKTILCIAHKDAAVSNMVLGPVNLGLINLIIYENEEEALERLREFLLDFNGR